MMNCIVEINGREAIPVRAIPYIARELISPERLVSGLARTSFAKGFWYLNVFHISPDGSIGRMLPIDFNEIESNINDINRIDRYRDMTNNITPKIRFMRSICAFPPCFIWRDEFEEKYGVALEKIKSNDIDARLEDIEINFNPYMSPEEINIVFEGMPHTEVMAVPSSDAMELKTANNKIADLEQKLSQKSEKPLGTIERDSLLCIIDALCKEAKIDIKAKGAVKKIAIATEENGYPVSEDTVRRVLGKIHDALESRTK
jgi:hypothetical protein